MTRRIVTTANAFWSIKNSLIIHTFIYAGVCSTVPPSSFNIISWRIRRRRGEPTRGLRRWPGAERARSALLQGCRRRPCAEPPCRGSGRGGRRWCWSAAPAAAPSRRPCAVPGGNVHFHGRTVFLSTFQPGGHPTETCSGTQSVHAWIYVNRWIERRGVQWKHMQSVLAMCRVSYYVVLDMQSVPIV